MSLIWLMDYISKCDVLLVAMKEIAFPKNTIDFKQLESKFARKITRVNINKNNY